MKSTHRALRGLLERGKIEANGHNSNGRRQWRKLGSRDRAIAKAAGDVLVLREAMMMGSSARHVAQCLGVSKSTILRDLRSPSPGKGGGEAA